MAAAAAAVDGSKGGVVDGVIDESRGYWRWSKKDFLPEESFQTWNSYLSALSQTPHRIKDRALARSDDAAEISEIRRRSENDMKKCLTWWDLMWFGFSTVIGTGIFVLTGQQAHETAGPSIVISYAVSGFSALLSAMIYTEFAIEIPVAGGSFAYLRVELGDFVAYIAAANILLESILGASAVARSWTSYFTTVIGFSDTDALRIHVPALATDYSYLDPIAVAVLVILSTVAMLGMRHTSIINWVLTAFHVLAILLVLGFGFRYANVSNLNPFLPYGVGGMFRAAAVVYFAYTGFDALATMAEETKKPARDIPIGLVGSMILVTVIYCLMALSLVMMQNYTQIDPNAAYSVAFQMVGMNWVKVLVGIGALKGMTTVLLVGALGQARYTTHIARAHMIPPLFALVHPKTQTPVYATLLVTSIAAVITLFSSLDMLANLLSISTLFIFTLMSIALMVRRYYKSGTTTRSQVNRLSLGMLLIIGASIGISAYWRAGQESWIGYAVFGSIFLVSNFYICICMPQVHTPKVWGVPKIPWLASISILLNIFLMGSLDYGSFIRFGVCTLFMLVYYVFFGVHAAYDTANNHNQGVNVVGSNETDEKKVRLEEGVAQQQPQI